MSESAAMALKLAKIKLKLPVLRRCSTKGSSCGSQLALQLRALRLGLLAEAALKRQLLLGFLEFTEPVAGRRHVSGSASPGTVQTNCLCNQHRELPNETEAASKSCGLRVKRHNEHVAGNRRRVLHQSVLHAC